MTDRRPLAEPVRWGILGAGRISTIAMGPAIAATADACLVAVAATDPSRAARIAPDATAYGDYGELLADPDVEVVYCALPNQAHLPWTLEALGRGKHVLCEKPLALDAAQVDQAATAARESGRILVEASWYRWHPRTQRAQALVSSGVIGQVLQVDAGFTFSGVPLTDYRMDPLMGGGALYDVGCYALSAVGWALDWVDLDVMEASARMSPSGVDIAIEATLRAATASQPTARVRAAFDEEERQWLTIRGESGSLRFGPPAFSAWSKDATTLEVVRGRDVSVENFPACNPYRTMVESVSRAVRGEPSWVVPLDQSRAVSVSIDSIRRRL